MGTGYLRYFIGFIITLGLIIVLIMLLFSGGNNSKVVNQRLLSSYADTNSMVIMTIDGPVNAPEKHNQIRVSIDRDTTTFQQLSGYDGLIVNAKSYTNTKNSYTAFLKSLSRAGYMLGNKASVVTDPTGYCSMGDRYTFELIDEGTQVQKFWNTSCGGNTKTYNGNTNLTMTLFQAQVPDYFTLTQNIDL